MLMIKKKNCLVIPKPYEFFFKFCVAVLGNINLHELYRVEKFFFELEEIENVAN